MPFNIGCSGHERDIVQVDDLPSRSMGAINFTSERVVYLQLQIELRLREYQPVNLCWSGACDRLFDSLVLSNELSVDRSSETIC